MPGRDVFEPYLGRRMRELRKDRGISLRALARRVSSNSSSLSEYETGKTLPTRDTLTLIDTALTAGGQLVAMLNAVAADSALPGGRSLLDRVEQRRRGLHDAVSVGAVSAAGLDDWEQVVLRHGYATRCRPAITMLAELDADCAELQQALARRHTSAGLRRLTRVTAQMAGLMFLTLIKLGDPLGARAWAQTARVAAVEAGDSALCSWVWAQEAYVCYYSGGLTEAVDVAKHAQVLAGHTVCVGAPLAAALESRAMGALGKRREALDAIRRAELAVGQLDSAARRPSAFGYNEAQLRFHEGNAFTHLHDTKAALTAQQQALDLYPFDDFLDRTLLQLDQAACLVYDGDTDTALTRAASAVVDLTPQQRTGLVTIRTEEILSSLAPRQRALPAAEDLHDLLSSSEKG